MEFKCVGNENLYLNPILDLYNGEVISYGISNKPTLDVVIDSLEQVVNNIKHGPNIEPPSIQAKDGITNIING
ncbi:transposase InsO family protein [Alkalibacillus filiformis]|uniref:Transposase InsO family protein n=1 Tax=Alkalibacillus filiformis TaxID=200990 RepID=A0ABU0DTE8_9BACI|nr:transposase InsO family protein [Alkalibacillus filiformis]